MQPTESGPAQPQSHPLPPPPAPQRTQGSSQQPGTGTTPLPPPASSPRRYRKRPVVIEAIQWTGSNLDELRAFVPEEHRHNKVCEPMGIKTLEGVMTISLGDFIIRGVNGEFYPCKPDIFAKTYEEAPPTPYRIGIDPGAPSGDLHAEAVIERGAEGVRVVSVSTPPSPSDAGEFIENGRHKRGERLCRGIGVQFPKGKGSRALERYAVVVPAQGTRAEFVKAYRLLADALERGEGAVMGENRLVESEVNAADYPGEYVDSMTLEVEEQAKMEAAKASRPAPVIEPEPPDGEDFQPARDANGASWSPRSGDEVELRTTGERGVVVSFCPACYWTVKWSNGASSMVSALSLRPAGKMPATPKLRPAFDHLGRPLFRFGDTVHFRHEGRAMLGVVHSHVYVLGHDHWRICTNPPNENPALWVPAHQILGLPEIAPTTIKPAIISPILIAARALVDAVVGSSERAFRDHGGNRIEDRVAWNNFAICVSMPDPGAEMLGHHAANVVALVEGPHAPRWQAGGLRLKDTREWCAFYSAFKAAERGGAS